MGAFETNLVAISWHQSRYAVVSQTIAHIDTGAMKRDGLFNDVSEDAGYIDEAAILQKSAIEKYFLPDSNAWHEAAKLWYASLPRDTMFILVHRAEWESGLSD
jgi:hypothetical protein